MAVVIATLDLSALGAFLLLGRGKREPGSITEAKP
jgi:hypothetical protein